VTAGGGVVCRGGLGIIDAVGRVGHAGGISVRAGACKHVQTSPDLMLGLPPHCWAHLAGFWMGQKLY